MWVLMDIPVKAPNVQDLKQRVCPRNVLYVRCEMTITHRNLTLMEYSLGAGAA